MKKFLKENIKFIIVIFICIVGSGLSTYATEYLFNSNEVQYDNSTSGIRSSNVQDAIDELYSCASDYSAYDSRLTSVEDYKNQIYPIGSIYISVSNTNPSTLFGGTWESFGQGRTLIGVGTGTDSNSTEKVFDADESGGEYSHTLTVNEMPSHNHSVFIWNSQNSNYTAVAATGTGWSRAAMGLKITSSAWQGSAFSTAGAWGAAGAGDIAGSTSLAGSNNYHNNIQPYITVYMWKRTG